MSGAGQGTEPLGKSRNIWEKDGTCSNLSVWVGGGNLQPSIFQQFVGIQPLASTCSDDIAEDSLEQHHFCLRFRSAVSEKVFQRKGRLLGSFCEGNEFVFLRLYFLLLMDVCFLDLI